MLALMSGLQDGGSFKIYLGRNCYKTLVEVLIKANEFIKSEEMSRATSSKRKELETSRRDERSSRVHRRDAIDRRDVRRKDEGREDDNRSRKEEGRKERQERYAEYTPLTHPRVQIFDMDKDDNKCQQPPKMMSNNCDSKKYCDFHKEHGHLTEECIHLKDNIEELIRRGYLAQFKACLGGSSVVENQKGAITDEIESSKSETKKHKTAEPRTT